MAAAARACAAVCIVLTLGGCDAAYYGTMEKFGVYKSDILVDRVEDAMSSQEEAKEEFKTAYQRFSEVVDVAPSALKDTYEDLNDAYERAADKASDVSSHIESVESVSEDLFEEWRSELEMMSNAKLKSADRDRLRRSERAYDQLIKAMRRAESRMAPVLTSLHDHVLYLKHNLNAQAITSLKGELGAIETDVGRLIREMETSIANAQSYISVMEKGG